MADLVRLLSSTSGLVVLTVGFGLWISAKPTSKIARRGLIVVAVAYLVASIYAVGYLLERPLTRGFQPLTRADVPDRPTAIAVLGSGNFTARDWDGGEYTVVSEAAAERVREAARVFAMIDAAWVITSGGRAGPTDPNVATAIAMHDALLQLGLPSTRLHTLTDPRNTYEEAVAVKPLLARLGAEQVVLITSASHMRRAVGAFRAAGVTVIPAIARSTYQDRSWSDWWLPSANGLAETDAVAHEYLGMVAYAIRGRFAF